MRSRGQHHFATFYVVQALDDPELADLAFELDSYRSDRHETVSDFEDESQRAHAQWKEIQELFADFLPRAEAWMTQKRPSLAARLHHFNPRSLE